MYILEKVVYNVSIHNKWGTKFMVICLPGYNPLDRFKFPGPLLLTGKVAEDWEYEWYGLVQYCKSQSLEQFLTKR